MDPQQIGSAFLALFPLDVRLQLAFDGLEEARDVLGFFEGFAAVQLYLQEAGAEDADIAKTVAVLRMVPRDLWEPVDRNSFLPPAAAVMLSKIFQPPSREAFPPAPPMLAILNREDAETPKFEAADLAAEPPTKILDPIEVPPSSWRSWRPNGPRALCADSWGPVRSHPKGPVGL